MLLTEPRLPEGTIVDLRYAQPYGPNREILYEGEDAVLRLDQPAAEALTYAAELALQARVRLVVWDGYRPPETHQRIVEMHGGTDEFVLDPEESNHPKGLAADVTLADNDGKLLDMGTDFDEFGEACYHDYGKLTWIQKLNRDLLRAIMKQAGFSEYEPEWWHYNYLPEAPITPVE